MSINIDPQQFWADVFAKEDELVARGLVWDAAALRRDMKGRWFDPTHGAYAYITSIPNATMERLREHVPGRTMPWELRIAAMALSDATPLHREATIEEIAAYKLDCEVRSKRVDAAEEQRKGNSNMKDMQAIVAAAVETAMREGNAGIASAVEAAVKAVTATRDEGKASKRARKEVEALNEELEREEVTA